MEQIPGVPEVAEFVDDELSSLGEEADGKPSVFFGFESICVVSGGPSGLESPQTGEGEYSNELTDASGFAAEVPVGAVQAEMNPMLRFVNLLQDPASQMNSRETNLAKETLQARIIGVRFDSWLQIF